MIVQGAWRTVLCEYVYKSCNEGLIILWNRMSVKIGNNVAIVMSEGGMRRFESTYSTKDEKNIS